MKEEDRQTLQRAMMPALEQFHDLNQFLRLRFVVSLMVTYVMNTEQDPHLAMASLGFAAWDALQRAMDQERERSGSA